MLCANLDCVWLMFNALKVAQAEKQIYPESLGKLTKARSAKIHDDQASPGAGTAPVTRAGLRCGAVITRMTAGRTIAAATTGRSALVSAAVRQPTGRAPEHQPGGAQGVAAFRPCKMCGPDQ